MIDMAKAMGVKDASSGKDFIKALDDLIASVGCSDLRMSDAGITKEELKKYITADPVLLSDEDYLAIYEASYK